MLKFFIFFIIFFLLLLHLLLSSSFFFIHPSRGYRYASGGRPRIALGLWLTGQQPASCAYSYQRVPKGKFPYTQPLVAASIRLEPYQAPPVGETMCPHIASSWHGWG